MKNNGYIRILIVAATLLLAACSDQYVGMPRAEVLDYQNGGTYGSLYNLAAAYAESINSAVKQDTLHPGLYAEYGVTLALMGHNGEACRMLNSEVRAFPQSRHMVRRIKERLLPTMVDDTIASPADTADILKLESWAYDSITALKPLPRIVAVIDSTDSVSIRLQTPVDSVEYPVRLTANQKREILAQEQAKEEARLKFVEDSIAAAKQAKIDARKQAKLDKQKARKEQQKAKKQAEKEKKRAAKEKAKQREAEKQRKAAERKAQQEAARKNKKS